MYLIIHSNERSTYSTVSSLLGKKKHLGTCKNNVLVARVREKEREGALNVLLSQIHKTAADAQRNEESASWTRFVEGRKESGIASEKGEEEKGRPDDAM